MARKLIAKTGKPGPYGKVVYRGGVRRLAVNDDGQQLLTEYLEIYPRPSALLKKVFGGFYHWARNRLQQEDLDAACIEGMTLAMCQWDPEISAFATYAARWMYHAVQRQAAIRDLEKQRLNGVRVTTANVRSKKSDDEVSLIDLVGKSDSPGLCRLDRKWLRQEIMKAIKRASPSRRYQEILLMRFGIHGGEPLTLEEVAAVFKITRERVRQIEAKIIRKVERELKGVYASYID